MSHSPRGGLRIMTYKLFHRGEGRYLVWTGAGHYCSGRWLPQYDSSLPTDGGSKRARPKHTVICPTTVGSIGTHNVAIGHKRYKKNRRVWLHGCRQQTRTARLTSYVGFSNQNHVGSPVYGAIKRKWVSTHI